MPKSTITNYSQLQPATVAPSNHLLEFEGFSDGGCIRYIRYNKGSCRHKLHKSGQLALFPRQGKVP